MRAGQQQHLPRAEGGGTPGSAELQTSERLTFLVADIYLFTPLGMTSILVFIGIWTEPTAKTSINGMFRMMRSHVTYCIISCSKTRKLFIAQ